MAADALAVTRRHKSQKPTQDRAGATLLPEDDPGERQRALSRGHPLRALNALNALAVRGFDPELLAVRIDVDPLA
jgi:hypothetical protein